MKKKTSFTSEGCKSILSLLVAFVLAACGGDSSSKSDDMKDSSNQDYNNPDYEYVVTNASITGAALKGPFKFDSPLELHELLLENDTRHYSGNDYIDEISSNKGDFVIPKVNLVSPYAELVVEGLWQNEVSGQWSNTSLKLRALVDLNERTEVNVNLLTELEYDRAVNLVNRGYGVLAAKKQAEFEIMTAFGFSTTVENAEDLKMFVDSADNKHEANATLMAISLLFLGDRDEPAVVKSLESFKTDFTLDGSWDDNQMKVDMADWAESFDNTVVRVNAKNWNILEIPKFETYLNVFWNNIYGLGGCAKNRYGTIAKNSNSLSRNYDVYYICVDDQWRRTTDYEKDTYLWTDGKEGETKKGNVTGADYVFRNGTWIAPDSDDDEESCDKTRAGEKLSKDGRYYACENGTWKEIDENDYYVLRDVSVTGSAQKGPFKFNSPLKIKEMLLRNDSLIYTGREYKDEVSSNTGDFVVPKVSLVYPYATMEVRGQWRNEITGEWSKDSITLRALTELSQNANINILTHLEYDRALNLVKKGYSVSAAKTQADYEIMTAFAIIPTTSNSEAKLTFGEGADPTLLALAILFIGDRNDFEIQKTINNFKKDIATDGVWNDEQTKVGMADYAENFNSSVVHANVKSWNISIIPDFETQLATFWNNAYGLGGCASTRNGLVLKNNNSLSLNYGVHYICESNMWRRATDYEKDTYKWSKGTTGEVKKGDVTGTYYSYNGSKWVVADRENDIGICKGSTGVVKEYDEAYYICRLNNWVEATTLEYDTYGWAAGKDGEVKPGSVNTDKYYVYENGNWRASTGLIENNLGACVTTRLDEVGKSGNTYYTCKTGGWKASTVLEYDTYCLTAENEGSVKTGCVNTNKYYVYENGNWRTSTGTIENNLGACVTSRLGEVGKSGTTYYTCKTDGWKTSTVLEYDTYGKSCLTDGSIVFGEEVPSNKYVCDTDTFRIANIQEISLNKGCVSYTECEEIRKQIFNTNDSIYTCKNGIWIGSIDYLYGSLMDLRDNKVYKTVVIGTQTWMAENLNYSDSINYPSMLGGNWCYNNKLDSCTKYGRLYSWSAAMDSMGTFSTNGKWCGYGYRRNCSPTYPVRGICPAGWHLPDSTEFSKLFEIVGGKSVAGKALKSTSGWILNRNGEDAYSFSALPAGSRYYDGNFINVGYYAIFWSSAEDSYDYDFARVMSLEYNGGDGAFLFREYKNVGLSVRCLRD